MSKAEVSGDYLQELRRLHGWKQPSNEPLIFLTGAKNEGSIGNEIAGRFPHSVVKSNNDVRSHSFNFMDFSALIMCHGQLHLDWIEDAPEEKIKEVLEVNLFGSIRLVQQFVQQTIASGTRKKIISIGSMAHRNVLGGSAAYCASKAGLAHFMKCAAFELTPKGFEVFCIHPTNVEGTPMAEETIAGLMRYRSMERKMAEDYWSTGLLRERWLNAKDIADLVEFIIHGNSNYLSGSNIELAGGHR